MSSRFRLSLTALLVAVALAELLLNRIGVRLLAAVPGVQDSPLVVVDRLALFLFYFTGVLALGVFTWAAVVTIRGPMVLHLPERMAFAVVSALFLPLAAMGTVGGVPAAMAPHLNTSFALLVLVVLVGFLRRPAPLRSKLGVFYLTVPILLHSVWLLFKQVPALAPAGSLIRLPDMLFEGSEHLVVLGAFAVFFFFAPLERARLTGPIPLVVALVGTALVGLLLRSHYSVAAQAAYYGLGLNLPPPSLRGLIHLLALFAFLLTITALTLQGGRHRAQAVGLSLVGVSGFLLQLPYQFLLTLLGLMELTRAARTDPLAEAADLTSARAGVSSEDWKAFLGRLARACCSDLTDCEAVQLHTDQQQVAQLRGRRHGLPFVLRMLHDPRRIDRLDLSVGAPGREPAPVLLCRRRGGRGRPLKVRNTAPRRSLGDPGLETQFLLRDEGGQAAELLLGGGRADALGRLLHGCLELWPGEGLRYRVHPADDGFPLPLAEMAFNAEDADPDAVVALLDLLCELTLEFE